MSDDVEIVTVQVLVRDGKAIQANLYVDGRFVKGEGLPGGAPVGELVDPLVAELRERFPVEEAE